MAWNYVVTAHKSTAVSLGLTGYFTHSKRDTETPLPDLLVVKGRNLCFYQLVSNGLKLYMEIPFFAKFLCLESYHLSGCGRDVLCFLTSWNLIRIVELNGDKLITRAHGSIEVLGGQPTTHAAIMRVDQEHGIIGIMAFTGYLHTISLSVPLSSRDRETAQVVSSSLDNNYMKISELVVVDFVFLKGCSSPTIAILTQALEGRQIRTYEVGDSLSHGPIPSCLTPDSEAHLLIPIDASIQGVLVVGRSYVSYHNPTCVPVKNLIPKQREAFSCYVEMDSCRMVLGDDRGQLYMLLLNYNSSDREVKGVHVECLGLTCIPSFLGYLREALYIGSKLGDSQLIKFTNLNSSMVPSMEIDVTEKSEPQKERYFEVLESIPNIGPIVDMQVVDLEKHGQGQLVTCSGYRTDGSLRIVRNGIGIESKATVDWPGIVSVWTLSLHKSLMDGACTQLEHDTIVYTSVYNTCFIKLLGLDMEEFGVTEMGDLESNTQSLLISNAIHGQIIQVTSTSVRLLKAPALSLLSQWSPPSGLQIDKVAGNNRQLLVSVKTRLIYIVISDGQLQLASERELHHEISCLDISPMQPFGEANVCAICLWPIATINLISLPNLSDISATPISKHKNPGSIQLCWDMEGVQYLLCTMDNDGSLLYFQIDPSCGALFNEKNIILGKDPVRLIQFFSHGKSNIFACSDKPTIIYSNNRKLTFSDVDQPKVICMASLNNEFYPEHLILVHYNQLEIGKIDKIQKLHIRQIPLEETPFRIAHQEHTKTLGVLSCRYGIYDSESNTISDSVRSASLRAPTRHKLTPEERASVKSITAMMEDQEEVEIHSLLILDQQNFDVLISYELKQQESAVSIISYIVKNVAYYIVGTAVVLPFQEEPIDGRLLAFQLSNGRLELVHVVQVPGAVYSLKSFNELILCSINATIALYAIDLDNGFKEVGTYSGSVLSLMLKTKGDFVIVGDLMKSVTLLNYQKDKAEKFVEIAQDFDCKWMLALEFIDDDSFLGCENFCNLFTLIKNPDVSSEAEQSRLVQFGQFYLGESVNVFTHGSLVMDTAESRPDFIQGKSIIFGGVSGSVGLVIPISEDAYNILMTAQTRFLASDYTTSVGNIEHSDWRTYRSQIIKKTPQNFIDGDVVEILLELPRLDMINLISEMEIKDHKGGVRAVSPEEVFRIIEELARLH